MSTSLKNRLRDLLAENKMDEAVTLGLKESGAIRALTGMSYDKATELSWRAMDAIGRIAARMPVERVRNLIGRVLWMMREESGTDPWSAAEILGEILAANPKPFADVIPILICFHEEPILRAGALRGIFRLALPRPEMVAEFAAVPLMYLGDTDPQVRGYAALATGATGAAGIPGSSGGRAALERMLDDNAPFLYYDNEKLQEITVAGAARIGLGEVKG